MVISSFEYKKSAEHKNMSRSSVSAVHLEPENTALTVNLTMYYALIIMYVT